MLRLFFLAGLALGASAACAGSRPPPASPDAARCLRLDEQAGVAPIERQRCWQAVAAAPADTPATPGARNHATVRSAALSGATTEGTIADTPARWGLSPAPPGVLPPPAPATPAAPREQCRARARTCDGSCNGSAAWSTCLARCDAELAVCLGQ